jgi:non-specific protein-tyrosine kinase
MTSGAESLKTAVRRSFLLVVALAILGAVAVDVFTHVRGPRYEATARVLISTTPLSKIITGTEPPFVDPQRIQDTAQTLASSPQVYALAERRTGGRLGSAGSLQDATTVAAGNNTDVLSFTASGSEATHAVDVVNAVARAYIVFRARLSGAAITDTIAQLRKRLASAPPTGTVQSDLQQELNRLELLQSLNSSDAVLVQRAVSATKTSPAPTKDTLLGLSIGLVIGLLLAALREAIDTTVRSEADVEELLATPVLATIRPLPARKRLVTYGRHQAAYADTYALLAAQLLRRTEGTQPLVLAVTSALSKEGKTSTAANLAVTLARRGSSVILADFDFRRPVLGPLFGLPKLAPGTLQVVAGSRRLDEVLWSVALEGRAPTASQNGVAAIANGSAPPGDANGDGPEIGSLHLLPSGGSIQTQRVAHSPRLVELVSELRTRADIVVLDTPPAMLTVEMSELARTIDLVLVVVRQGWVTQRTLRSLGRQAQAWETEVAGAVLTGVASEQSYSYYGGR